MNDIHKKQTCMIPKDRCHELQCWCLCYEFLCCRKRFWFHITYAFLVSDVTRLAVWVYCSTTLLYFYNVSNVGGRDPYRELCGLVSTACQHSHVFQLVMDTLAKRPVGVRCQAVVCKRHLHVSHPQWTCWAASVAAFQHVFRRHRMHLIPWHYKYSAYLHQMALNFHERKRLQTQKSNHISPERRYYALNLTSRDRSNVPFYVCQYRA